MGCVYQYISGEGVWVVGMRCCMKWKETKNHAAYKGGQSLSVGAEFYTLSHQPSVSTYNQSLLQWECKLGNNTHTSHWLVNDLMWRYSGVFKVDLTLAPSSVRMTELHHFLTFTLLFKLGSSVAVHTKTNQRLILINLFIFSQLHAMVQVCESFDI